MASYPVAEGERGVHAKTTAANTMDTVSFSDDCREVEVLSDGAASLYVTIDGPDATVAGAATDVLPFGGNCVRVVKSWETGPTVVRLISAGVVTYSVTRAS